MKKTAKPRLSPRIPLVIALIRHVRVAHHRHSGRMTPHQTTSYPMLAMILLVVGVFLAGWTQVVAADLGSYSINATVLGVAPTQPATIDSPIANSVVSTVPVSVSGKCPHDTYVELLRNNYSSGVAMCDSSGQYHLVTDLFQGSNQLIARAHNFADLPGPDSVAVTVIYKPTVAVAPTPSSVSSPRSRSAEAQSQSALPFLIKPSFAYLGFYVNDWARWQIEIDGGTAPYALSIDWGDGQHDLYSRAVGGAVTLRHMYHKKGAYKGSYAVHISASDGQGQYTFLQLIGIANNPPNTLAVTHSPSSAGSVTKGISWLTSGNLGLWAKYAWPSYGIALLMLLCFWLGERREAHLLSQRRQRPKQA